MPTLAELTDFINNCGTALSIEEMKSITFSLYQDIAEEILIQMQTSPIPSVTLMNESIEIKQLFTQIIRENILFLKEENEKKANITQFIQELQEFTSSNTSDPHYSIKLNAIKDKLTTMRDSRIITRTHINNMIAITGLRTSFRFNTYLSDTLSAEKNAAHDTVRSLIDIICFALQTEEPAPKKCIMSHNMKRSIAKQSLRLYSAQYNRETLSDDGPVHIIHFYEGRTTARYTEDEMALLCSPRSAEHLEPYTSDDEEHAKKTSFDKTSHGLGSGVYGLGSLTEEQIQIAIDERQDDFKIFKIEKPLRLTNDFTNEMYAPPTFSELSIDAQETSPSSPGLCSFQPLESVRARSISFFSDISLTEEAYSNDLLSESDKLTELSKYLQRVGDQVKNKRLSPAKAATRAIDITDFFSNPVNHQRLSSYAQMLCDFDALKKRSLSVTEAYDLLLCSMKDWFSDARPKTAEKTLQTVPMPINYVIKKLGYTGIISSRNDTFSRGLIDMEPVLGDGEMILKVIVKRAVRSSNSALWDTNGNITPLKNGGSIGKLISAIDKTAQPAPHP